MITSKKDLNFYLYEDMKRNLHTNKISMFKYWFGLFAKQNGCMAYHYLKSLRKFEYARNCLRGKSFWGNIIYYYRWIHHYRLSYKYNIDLRPNTIGYGLYLPHIVGGGIIVNCKSMGNYCAINSGVLLGNSTTAGIPIIGDYVDMTTGCKLYGKIVVGNNVIIAPNSVVVKDVPDNTVVSGIPAKFLKNLPLRL